MNKQELIQALKEGTLFDFIANNYHNASKWELKEIILAILSVLYDNYKGDYEDIQKQTLTILKEERDFFEED